MRKEIIHEIEIPDGVEVKLKDGILHVKGKEGEVSRKLKTEGLIFELKENKIIIGYKKATKNEKKLINTNVAHIKNMIKGVQEKFEYRLKVCFNHFPMTIEMKGNEALVKNFLGEKIPRKVKLLDGADVKINGQNITITSVDREIAGQTAANFEKATTIRMRDRRVFQDGIFMTNKAGREI